MMVGLGLPVEDVAKVMSISEPTLRKYFFAEIEVGQAEANAKVAASLFRQATDPNRPNVVAAIFWLKCRAGWREKDGEVPGKKLLAQIASRTAEQGTEWADLLPTPSAVQ